MTLAIALLVGVAFLAPEPVEASPYADSAQSVSCKKKRKSKKRRAKRKARRAKSKKKLTAKTIKRWQKKGWSNAKIVKKAQARGYTVTKKEAKRLKKYRVRKSLIAALEKPAAGAVAAAPAAPKGPAPIRVDVEMDPNDIDFDSVPPPDGMDMRFADMHRAQND